MYFCEKIIVAEVSNGVVFKFIDGVMIDGMIILYCLLLNGMRFN